MRKFHVLVVVAAMVLVTLFTAVPAFAAGEIVLEPSSADTTTQSGTPKIELLADVAYISDLTGFDDRKALLGGQTSAEYGKKLYFGVRVLDAAGKAVSGVVPTVYTSDGNVVATLNATSINGISGGTLAYRTVALGNHFQVGTVTLTAKATVNGTEIVSDPFTVTVTPMQVPTTTTLKMLTSAPVVGQPVSFEVTVSHSISSTVLSDTGLVNRFFAPGAAVKIINVSTGETLATGTLAQDPAGGQRAKATLTFTSAQSGSYTVQAKFEGTVVDAVSLQGS